MNLEEQLREALAPCEPGPQAEAAVMSRVSAAAWRASWSVRRRPGRTILFGTILVVAAAAASVIFVERHAGSSLPPEALFTGAVAPAVHETAFDATSIAPPAAPFRAAAARGTPPSDGPTVEEPCAAANAAPAAASYLVLAEPLRFEMDGAAIRPWLQQYYDAVLDQLRNVPGVELVGTRKEAVADKPADFRITVSLIGPTTVGQPGDTTDWRLSLQLEAWTGTAYGKPVSMLRPVGKETSSCPTGSATIFNCGPAGTAAFDVHLLTGNPVNPGKSTQIARFPTPAQVACHRESQKLSAQRAQPDPAISMSAMRLALDRLAVTTEPERRRGMFSLLRNIALPEHIPLLASAWRKSTDEAFRKEVVTLLAVKFADDPAAREALAAVAAGSPDALVRHVAERALSGDGPWRDYAVARVRDTSLPAARRLEAWYWMADAMPLDQQKMSDTLAGMLTALQEGDGVRVLVDLLASTQKNPSSPDYGLAGQQGQMALRQIGSVNHPAAPELLIASFDAMPNYLTLSVLATRRDDPRVDAKLESIAAEHADAQLRRMAASRLRQPSDPAGPAATGN